MVGVCERNLGSVDVEQLEDEKQEPLVEVGKQWGTGIVDVAEEVSEIEEIRCIAVGRLKRLEVLVRPMVLVGDEHLAHGNVGELVKTSGGTNRHGQRGGTVGRGDDAPRAW